MAKHNDESFSKTYSETYSKITDGWWQYHRGEKTFNNDDVPLHLRTENSKSFKF